MTCPDCYSQDMWGSLGDGKCRRCQGSGVVPPMAFDIIGNLMDVESVCSECDGTGSCPTCHGAGEV